MFSWFGNKSGGGDFTCIPERPYVERSMLKPRNKSINLVYLSPIQSIIANYKCDEQSFAELYYTQFDMQHSCHSHDLLPDYIHQVMATIVNPTFSSILKLLQIKKLASEKSLANKQHSKEKEYCDILSDELALEGTHLQKAYKVNGNLVGYMTMFTAESSKCEKESFVINKMTCYVKVSKTVTHVYGLYEKSAKHALKELENINRYVTRLADKCFQDSTYLL